MYSYRHIYVYISVKMSINTYIFRHKYADMSVYITIFTSLVEYEGGLMVIVMVVVAGRQT
jgi:hypothetical protein